MSQPTDPPESIWDDRAARLETRIVDRVTAIVEPAMLRVGQIERLQQQAAEDRQVHRAALQLEIAQLRQILNDLLALLRAHPPEPP